MVQKKKWVVIQAENWKSGPLWGKLLSYDFSRGTTEIIVADHFMRRCESVIRFESLLQMKSVMPGKYYFLFFFFHLTGKLTHKIPCLLPYVSESSFLLNVGFCYLTIICYI